MMRIVKNGLLLLLVSCLSGVSPRVTVRASGPAVTAQELFPGITYTLETWTDPRPVSIHIIRVDLTAPGIGFLVTPPDDPAAHFHTNARFTSGFLAEHGLQLAINGAFFDKDVGSQESLLDRVYLEGEPTRVLGLAVSGGVPYASDRQPFVPLFISPQNEVSIGRPTAQVAQAIAGWPLLVWDGVDVTPSDIAPQISDPNPRTALGLTADGREMLLFVTDGKIESSAGLTFHELADLMIAHGVWAGLNLDGGGSSTLAVVGADGLPQILNVPVGNLIPGSERPVANHLGIYAGGG